MHYRAHTYGARKEDQKLKIINQQSQKITLFNMREGWLYSNACGEEEGLEPIKVLTLV